METPTRRIEPVEVTGMRLVGGNLALDFVNSQSGPAGGEPDADAFGAYSDLLAWAGYVCLLSRPEVDRIASTAQANPTEAGKAFDRAIAIRGYLYQLFVALATGAQPPAAALAALAADETDALSRAQLLPAIPQTGRFEWSWAECRDLGRPIWPVVHAAVELLSAGLPERIKGCAACRFLFVDTSKNGSRRWCSMEDCGANEKMRRYVVRRRQRAVAAVNSRRQQPRH